MTQQCALPTAKDGGEALSMLRQEGVPDRVDTPIDEMDPARLLRPPKRLLPITKPTQLRQAHDPVLLRRQSRQPMVTSPLGVHLDT